MLLSQITPPGAAGEAALAPALSRLAAHLYDSGWTVIGSRYKTPGLHPWKEPSREQLLAWAQDNFRSGKANSINLRLADSNVIALDCDFVSPDLTEAFVDSLAAYLAVPRKGLYTCAGARGCKVFLRCFQQGFMRRLRQHLGPKLTADPAGSKADTVLEIKTTVSTVAGMHSSWGTDGLVYGPYSGCSFIAAARPSELPEVNHDDLDMIEELYTRIVSAARSYYVPGAAAAAAPAPYIAPGYYQLTAAAVALFMEDLPAQRTEGVFFTPAAPDSDAREEYAPLYRALGLYEAWGYVCSRYWPADPAAVLMDSAFCRIQPDIASELYRDFSQLTRSYLHNRATRAEGLMRDYHRILRIRALAAGLDSAAAGSTQAVYRALYSHNCNGGH